MRPTKILVLLLWIALTHPGESAAAQICQPASIPASTPTSRFTDSGDGTVTDTVTGLMWKRCAEGQSWDGVTCAGSAPAMTWHGALQAAESATFASHGDWRLPNIKELGSIVERQCVDPAINLAVFPAAPSSHFWSGSPYAGDSYSAWGVYFYYGYGNGSGKGYGFSSYVRLVRGGQ
jgi:hypothetical protein